MNTIALETSGSTGSLALLRDGVVVSQAALPRGTRVTQSYAPKLHEALAEAGWSPQQVDLFAVCRGPGSFTGLRIAVTAAKVYAYATGCAVLGLNTLEVIAAQAPWESGRLWALLDAQRGQLFAAQFALSEQGPHGEAATRTVDLATWLTELQPGDAVSGPGLQTCLARLPAGVHVIAPDAWSPQAVTLGHLARQRFEAGERQDLWKLVPDYYRPSAAEEKWQARAAAAPDSASG